MMNFRAGLVGVICAVYGGMGGAAVAGDPSGKWVMPDGRVTVQVSKCSGELCAHVVGLREPLDKSGRPKVDRLNPDPTLRSRTLIGLALVSNMAPAGDNIWSGRIYNPDDGRTYTASMKLRGTVLQVKGCMAGILCKSSEFRRAK